MGRRADPGLTFEQAVAAVTAPGERFEIETAEVAGVAMPVFRNAPRSLREVIDSARDRGDATFLVYEDERWSFEEVMRHVDAMAALLVDRYRISPGDRVAIGMRNLPEWVVAFAAITSIGAISVSLNAWWAPDELDYALEDCGARVLIADAERAERATPAAARLDCRVLVVRSSDVLPARADRWEDVRDLGAPMPDVDVQPDADATILYTSGTTGHPKGAVSTHRAVVHALTGFACRTAIDRLRRPLDPADEASRRPLAFILVVPLFHVTGCVPVMLSCLAGGLKLVMLRKWDPDRALELIEREQVTTFVGVPTQSFDLLESPRFPATDTSSLVSVGGGGAPAPPELVKRVASSFRSGKPNIGYGMTETNAFGPGHNGEDYLAHPASTGRATPILELAVRDAAGADLPVGERGEIWFKGPHLIRGYWNRPDATAETIVDGWLRSGDIGRVDADGFVYVEDRAKDMVLRAGENVYSAEVEAAIYEHPGVMEAAVFGVPHPRLGEEVAAAVHPRPGQRVTAEEVRAVVAGRLAAFKVPSIVVILDAPLPRNAAGKFLKRELRDRVAGGAS